MEATTIYHNRSDSSGENINFIDENQSYDTPVLNRIPELDSKAKEKIKIGEEYLKSVFDPSISSDEKWGNSHITPPKYISPKICLTHQIADELFDLTIENGTFLLTHPVWSLEGEGKKLIEAEKDILKEARELSTSFFKLSISELDENALGMRNFLLEII